MRVRILFHSGPKVRLVGTKNQKLALAFAALLKPALLGVWSLVLWRLASDLGQAGTFGIEGGLFSHWQMWLAVAFCLHGLSAALMRFGRRPRLVTNPESKVSEEALPH
jgi:hypothetical protein